LPWQVAQDKPENPALLAPLVPLAQKVLLEQQPAQLI
jgi:hypothetical protein